MANFATHIGVGTIVSGTLATLTLAADVVAPENLIAVTLAGVLGSVLPDIDLKDSRASRGMFSGLAIFFSFCVLFTIAYRYSIAEMWVMWLGTFVLVRYGGEALFHRMSYHRGIFHSVLAGLMFWFLTTVVFKHVLGRHEGVAWLAGGFLFIGYLTHLLLDEMYSVDVLDRRVKSSFGTALKLWDRRYPGQSVAVALACVALFVATPAASVFVEGMTSRHLWEDLRHRLLPEDQWFGGLVHIPSWHQPGLASDIATGSLPASRPEGESVAAPAR